LIIANGFGSKFYETAGMSNVTKQLSGGAIGLICNLTPTGGKQEKELRSFALSSHFFKQTFSECAKQTGIDLENIIYVRSDDTHYFVCTPKMKSLVEEGIVKDPSDATPLAMKNLDVAKLQEVTLRIAVFPWVSKELPVLEALKKDTGGVVPAWADTGPRLFDFSKTCRSSEGMVCLPGENGGNDLMVALTGDALMEPFWPEGLGIIRGFFGVLDAVYGIKEWSGGLSSDKVLDNYRAAYAQLRGVNGFTKGDILQSDWKKYALPPNTRYKLVK
jgi:hypothetical protein